MSNPLVSIIIPTFNRSYIIGETLDSILSQSCPNWECIVVDDGSFDYTMELMEFYCSKDKRITYHQRPAQSRKGANSCRNFGFKLSKGNYINWIDSDDILAPWAIERKLKSIGDNNVLVSGVTYIDKWKKPIELSHRYIPQKNIIEEYFIGHITFYVTPLWERSFLNKQEELFDEMISNLDDWDFNLRMLYKFPKINYLHEPLMSYRLHSNSLSHEIGKLNWHEIKSEFYARKKHFKLLKGNKAVNFRLLKIYDKEKCKSILRLALNENNSKKFSLFGMLIRRHILLIDVYGLIITTTGFLSYSIFGKGNRFFRRKFP